MRIIQTALVRGSLVAVALACMAVARLDAQDGLQTLRQLYEAAAYEDALAAVGQFDAAAPNLEAEQYRVSCLVALGRVDEADRAVEAVLTARPEYRPDPDQASPRILTMFSQVRRRIGPGLVKRMYQAARTAMENKDRDETISRFEAMLRVADAPEVRSDPTVGELRELGGGFLELSRALLPQATPLAVSPTPVAAPRSQIIVPPSIIQQRLPSWIADLSSRTTSFEGAVRVQISAEGRVVSAEIVKSIHPAYDRLLLRAARGWLYKPAQKDGLAIAIEKTVEVKVAPASGESGQAARNQQF